MALAQRRHGVGPARARPRMTAGRGCSASGRPSREARRACGSAPARAPHSGGRPRTLGPNARTRPCGWWNHDARALGRRRRISARRDPGLALARSGRSHGSGRRRAAFARVPRASPSGFRFGTTQSSARSGRAGSKQSPCNGQSRRLVAVDAADDQQPARAPGCPVGRRWIGRPSRRAAEHAARRGAGRCASRTCSGCRGGRAAGRCAGGPRRPVCGPTKTLTAPAGRNGRRGPAPGGGRSGPPVGRALPAVEARVVDVGVEPVLVRDVAEPAEARPEVAAARTAEVADSDPRRLRVRQPVLVQDARAPCARAVSSPSGARAGSARASAWVPGEVAGARRAVSCTPLASAGQAQALTPPAHSESSRFAERLGASAGDPRRSRPRRPP